jgi:GH15 family glucan-1,4-alpha-glucosidase
MCWSAIDRGLQLARDCGLPAPAERWAAARDELRETIDREGFDETRGTFVQAFGHPGLDAAALLLPAADYVAWDDPRMIGTVDAIRDELAAGDGLLYRYRREDGLGGHEGAFLACSFWLAECLARQGRVDEAQEVFAATAATSNDLGIYSEQYDPDARSMLGNIPQALTHLAHIGAALALADQERGVSRNAPAPWPTR